VGSKQKQDAGASKCRRSWVESGLSDSELAACGEEQLSSEDEFDENHEIADSELAACGEEQLSLEDEFDENHEIDEDVRYPTDSDSDSAEDGP